MLAAAAAGYYGVVVGKRREEYRSALRSAFPPGNLLELSTTELEGDSRGAKAGALLRRVVAWQRERPEVAAAAVALAGRVGAPLSRGAVRRHAQDCPCCHGPGAQQEQEEQLAGQIAMALRNPGRAVQLLRGGGQLGHHSALSITNALAPAVTANLTPAVDVFERHGLLEALAEALAAAQAAADYIGLATALLLASNVTRFRGARGDELRARLFDLGLEGAVLAAKYCRDAPCRDAATQVGAPRSHAPVHAAAAARLTCRPSTRCAGGRRPAGRGCLEPRLRRLRRAPA